MAALVIIALTVLIRHSRTSPVPVLVPYESNHPSCVEFMLPVSVTANNSIYDAVPVNSNIDVIAFVDDIYSWSSPKGTARIVQNITISGTYDISTQLFILPNGGKKSHLQIATHGLLFDKRYWDSSVNPSEYSYVDAALAAGYSILTYDRLGTGKSDKPDAYKVVQAPLELEILRSITEMSRNGKIHDYAKTAPATKFDKVIHVGHSFGSFLTSALLTTYPNISDAAIITGYVLNEHLSELKLSTLGAEYAPQNDPQLFSSSGSGYLVTSMPSTLQTGFFSMRQNTTTGLGGFKPEVLDYAFSIRQPITASEWLSPAVLNLGAALEFIGAVQFMIAEFDFVVCGGDCQGAYNATLITELFPQAKDVDFHIQDGTGHALTLHRGANQGYKVTLDWLEKNEL